MTLGTIVPISGPYSSAGAPPSSSPIGSASSIACSTAVTSVSYRLFIPLVVSGLPISQDLHPWCGCRLHREAERSARSVVASWCPRRPRLAIARLPNSDSASPLEGAVRSTCSAADVEEPLLPVLRRRLPGMSQDSLSGSENPPGPSNNPGTVATFFGERRRTDWSAVEPIHSQGSGVPVDAGSENAER